LGADIVLIDAMMPVMDGFATCRELRKHLHAARTCRC
jgi:CheY-like chemotaxis protein